MFESHFGHIDGNILLFLPMIWHDLSQKIQLVGLWEHFGGKINSEWVASGLFAYNSITTDHPILILWADYCTYNTSHTAKLFSSTTALKLLQFSYPRSNSSFSHHPLTFTIHPFASIHPNEATHILKSHHKITLCSLLATFHTTQCQGK